MKPLFYNEVPSAIGPLGLCGTQRGLTHIFFQETRHGPSAALRAGWSRDESAFPEARRQLEEYFAGTRTTFDVAVDTDGAGGTAFQRRVWAALREVSYGATVSYGELARRIGQPTAVRAVGLANGRNPLPIIVPCHRVIGADGSLTGFGGGVDRKRLLLDLERRHDPAMLL